MKIDEFAGKKRAGSDESGKGDLFGPLVVAGIVLRPEKEAVLLSHNIRDSKKITNNVIRKLAAVIRENAYFEIVCISPKKFNELYGKMRNMNLILGWAHQRVFQNLHESDPFELALADKFSVKNRIAVKGDFTLYEFNNAEADVAVAAASILARDRFLSEMERMGTKFGMEFHRGASPQAVEDARVFIRKHGYAELSSVAKMNFKIVPKDEASS